MRLHLTLAQRFWRHVDTSDDCWIWRGTRSKQGYGRLGIRRADGGQKILRAHRLAYELIIGPIPAGKILDHIECDNPSCVNPGHLALSTDAENVLRGRSAPATNGAWSEQQFKGLLRDQMELALPAGRNGRVSVGVSSRMDKLWGLGDSVSPVQAEWIGRRIAFDFYGPRGNQASGAAGSGSDEAPSK